MLYADYVTALGTLLALPNPVAPTDPNFNNLLPRCIEFAELLMYRDPDLDFLANHTTDSSKKCTASARNITQPATVLVVEGINIITPASASSPDAGTRNPLRRVTLDFLDFVWPTAGTPSSPGTSVPAYYAPLDNVNWRVAPTPDQAYPIEFIGTFRPTPLSPANTSTFLTLNLPDLFLSASMIFMSGYQRNFGQQADDPRMALSWQTVYDGQKKGAAVEEARKKAQGPGWTANSPTPAATPPRS